MTLTGYRRPALPVRWLMVLACTWPPGLAQAQAEPPVAATAPGADAVAAHGAPQMQYLAGWLSDSAQAGRGTALPVLAERVRQAVVAHPDALGARAAWRGAELATRESQAAGLPTLGLSVEGGHNKNDPNTLLQLPARRYDSGSVALNLRHTLWDAGATEAAVAASREREAALAARSDSRQGDLALRAIQAWLEVYRSRRHVTLARLDVQARTEMVEFLSRRFRLGAGVVSDVWRAQSRLADATAAQAQAQARLGASESAFREIFAADPAVADLPRLPEIDAVLLAADPQDLVRDFPAVRSAEASRRAAERDVALATRRELPVVGVDVSARRRDLVGSGTPGTDLAAMLSLRYSLYGGGAEPARVGQAAQRLAEAAEQVRSLGRQVERALAQARGDDAVGPAVLKARREGVLLAIDAMRAVREQFSQRRGSLLDLLNAQETLHGAAVALLEAEVTQSLARWRLLYYTNSLGPLLGLEAAAAAAPAAPPAAAAADPWQAPG